MEMKAVCGVRAGLAVGVVTGNKIMSCDAPGRAVSRQTR